MWLWKQLIVVQYSSCGEPSRGAILSLHLRHSQPSATSSPPPLPLDSWQLKDYPLGSSEAHSGRFAKFPAFLCPVPYLVYWDVNEGNGRQLFLNLLIPILESVSKRKGQPMSTFPM